MSYTSISSAKARVDLQNSITDSKQFENALAGCFIDGSRAAAEAASIFLCKQATSATSAGRIGDALRTLPTAVTTQNAPPLAHVAAFIATGFDNENCNAPLQAFSFTSKEVKMAALHALVNTMAQRLQLGTADLSTLLRRVRSVFLESTDNVPEMDLYCIVRGIASLSYFINEKTETELLSFALDLCDGRSPYIHLDGVRPLSPQFQRLYIAQVLSIASDVPSTGRVLSRCLLHCVEFGDSAPFEALLDSNYDWVLDAMEISGFDLPIFILSVVAGQQAWRGNLSACATAIEIVLQLVEHISKRTLSVTHFVYLFVSSVFQAVGSIGVAAGAEQLAKEAASVIRLTRDLASDSDAFHKRVLLNTDELLKEAAKREWPACSLVLGVFRRMILIWESPEVTEEWVRGDFEVLIKENTGLLGSEDNDVGVVTSLAQDSATEDAPQSSAGDSLCVDLPAFAIMGMLLTMMRHEHSRIRFVCLRLLRKVRKESLFVFYFPSIMMLMQEETNGLLLAGYLREIMTSPGLMSSPEASNVTFSTLIRLSQSHINSEVYGVILVSFAWASEYAPSLGIRLLLRQLEGLKSSFDSAQAHVRTAAAAAIHKLAEVRPSRCTDFIPFVSLCITSKSMQVAPRAASLCFDVMYLMAKEQVLDPTKAVKVVVKTFPSATAVNPLSRRSYLRLLSVVAGGEANKKRQRMMQFVTEMLRKCVTDQSLMEGTDMETTTSCLSWEDIQQAAISLVEYTAEEILRSAFLDEEPLINLEEEKKRLDRIEAATAQFVRQVLITCDRARLNSSQASKALEKLVEKVLLHEWKTRKKSNFDPERIGKLRATSEALRRARKAQGQIQEESLPAEDQARGSFSRATTSFPIGVIRCVFEMCVDVQGNEKGKNANYKPSAVAMRVVTSTNILSPALPWVGMIDEVLSSSETEPFTRASCFGILRRIVDDTFEVKEKQAKWFGSQCSLFHSGTQLTPDECEQLFLGMVDLFPTELARLLRLKGKDMSNSLVATFIRSCHRIPEDGDGLQYAVEELFKLICDRDRHFEERLRKELEHVIVESGMRRCKSSAVDMILNADSGNASVIRIGCLYGNYQTISYAAQGVLPMKNGDNELTEVVGRAMHQLPFSQRRDILLMLFGNKLVSGTTAEKEVVDRAVEICAHALMVGGLVPGGKALLYGSLCSGSRIEQQMVQRLLNYVFSVIKD